MSKIKLIGKLFRTVKHLKFSQIYHQVKYKLKEAKPLSQYASKGTTIDKLSFSPLPKIKKVFSKNKEGYHFHFLNLSTTFKKKVDWNYDEHGKLWNYNLQYVDFLRQEDLSPEIRAALLQDLYDNLWNGTLALEPYPVSLRVMNTIRFLSTHDVNERLVECLKSELVYLNKNLEYHILGNHLLENSFALLMGGYFFKEKDWIAKASKLLKVQLSEQTLNDGAHFELSPMYHQIIFFRVLEAIDFLPKENGLAHFLSGIAGRMHTWLRSISFSNGNIPHLNDSSDGIAFTSNELFSFADDLQINEIKQEQMKDSGYRKYFAGELELVTDVNGIAPSYQPGHAHADTFTFCLNFKNKEVVVDRGISTYNICSIRDEERGTKAHNTITIEGLNSSEVWSGFRVGQRAEANIVDEGETNITAEHNGFFSAGIIHRRSFKILADSVVQIADELIGNTSSREVTANIHFDSSVNAKLVANTLVINDELLISFKGEVEISLNNYFLCRGFNVTEEAPMVSIKLLGHNLITEIKPL